MNLPNKLTVLRILLIPFFLLFLMTDLAGDYSKWIALGFFIIASLTDFFDGFLARKYQLITNFGKFMDPLADKLLVCSAMICFVELGRMPSWIVVVIIAREFIISGFRLVAAEQGRVIAAGWWGKVKTFVTMIMEIVMIINMEELQLVADILMYASLALTIISLIDYLVRNGDVLSEKDSGKKQNTGRIKETASGQTE
ncbi:MAG: CDP-diacylglycerol--glycerol-3-phosphate 3-phosphatidyltransferase [Lachnospiraceae bacterium]|nr:CDP-diacylglycerol--glycerol-3-phosphate 3-phosphatidyltransferase [Lachnospiraceae bacterium]